MFHLTRAVDPHSLFADPNSAVLLNADPDPAVFFNAVPVRIQLSKNFNKLPYEEFTVVEMTKNCSNVRNHGTGPNLLKFLKIILILRYWYQFS